MANENENLELNEPNEELDRVDDIQAWKASHVSKDKYDEIAKENKKLMKALMNGETINATLAPEAPVDVNKLRQELFGENSQLGVCDRFEKMLQLRDAEMKAGKPDPFFGRGLNLSAQEKAELARAGETYRHCLDVAQGDDQLFTMELQRLTKDVVIPRKKQFGR